MNLLKNENGSATTAMIVLGMSGIGPFAFLRNGGGPSGEVMLGMLGVLAFIMFCLAMAVRSANKKKTAKKKPKAKRRRK